MTPPETVAEAFGRYKARLESIATRILRDREEACDVASETFLSMLEGGPDDDAAAPAWLATSARNRALNRARDRARRSRILMRATDLPEADPQISDERLTELIRTALEELSERDQLALRMRYIQELGYEEISSALSIPPSQARLVVHRAARRLRRQTVAMLARHHGANEACLRRLSEQASAGAFSDHDGCRPCSAVADEVAAMVTHGVAPLALIPALRRLLDLPRHFLRAPRTASAGRVAEIAVALAMTSALAAPAPAVAAMTQHARSHRVTKASAAHGSVASNRVALFTGGQGGDAAGRSATETDAAGDTAQGSITNLVVLGRTLHLFDALNRAPLPALDIREFQVATVGRRGKPAGLLFTVTLAGPPKEAAYTIDWVFENDCKGEVFGSMPTDRVADSYGTFSINCPDEHTPDFVWNGIESLSIKPTVKGNQITFGIPYRKLGKESKTMLEPGDKLMKLVVTAGDNGAPLFSSSDRAPDEGKPEPTYTIQD